MLICSDAEWLHDEVRAVLSAVGADSRSVYRGAAVLPAVQKQAPDLVVLDFQVGNMGGMATCLELRLEESAGRLSRLPVLMLLDRRADVFLARRSQADGWLVNTAEAMRLFGYPGVPLARLIDWQADWIARGLPSLGKDTHFDTRDGTF